jgi:glycosyltransferase involved in cell wall biosynthesis
MIIAYQGCYRPLNGGHSTIWDVDDSYLRALARVDSTNRYILFNSGLRRRAELARRLANPEAPNFAVQVAPVPQRLVSWMENGLGWDPRGYLLRSQGAGLLHLSEPIYAPPPRFPTIVTFYDLIPEVYPDWSTPQIRRAMRTNARLAVHMTAISESTKRDIVRLYGVPEERVTVVLLAVEHDVFRPASPPEKDALRRELRLPDRFVLGLGPFGARKNFEPVLEAYARWKDRFPGLGLVFVGRASPYRRRLEETARNKGLTGVVFIEEVPDRRRLAGLYSLADVMVYPSLYEGFGLPVLEAMACGCPVAASRSTSIPEVLGEAGFLFALDDQAGMSEKVEALLSNAGLRAEMISKGLDRAARFTWEATARQTLALYERLWKEPRASRRM